MNKKISLGVALALALLLAAATVPLTMLYAQRSLNQIIPDLPGRAEALAAVEEIREVVQEQFFGTFNGDVVNTGMVQGFIAGLQDPLSRYLSAEEYKAYEQRLRGEQPEVGWELEYNPNSLEGALGSNENFGSIVIANVKAGSPAEASGLQSGDQLTKVTAGQTVLYDAAELTGNTYAEVIERLYDSSRIAKASSTTLVISYQRNDVQRPAVTVMVGSSVNTISQKRLAEAAAGNPNPEQTIGLIKIHAFYKNTAEQLGKAIKTMTMQQDITGIVLDLRGCSEGTVEYACAALDRLVGANPGSSMAVITYKNGQSRSFPSDAEVLTVLRGMVVLVDRFTQGAAELFAYNMRAYNSEKVHIIGTPTKGVQTVQEPFALRQLGGAVLLSVGTVVPMGGDANWNQNGVMPDPQGGVMVYNPSNPASQLQAAVAVLSQESE